MKQLSFIGVGLVIAIAALVMILSNDEQTAYERYGLEGLSTNEMIETLDEQTLDGDIISAGVLERELVIVTDAGETSYPIDESLFYLSIAPYIDQTHPCHNHNLVTCRSELANETVYVFIEDDNGTVLFDDVLTLYDNGFKGIWLPSDTEATITVEYGEYSVTTNITTYDDSGTCLTEPLKLTK